MGGVSVLFHELAYIYVTFYFELKYKFKKCVPFCIYVWLHCQQAPLRRISNSDAVPHWICNVFMEGCQKDGRLWATEKASNGSHYTSRWLISQELNNHLVNWCRHWSPLVYLCVQFNTFMIIFCYPEHPL